MSALTIARLTFREAARRKILWAALLLGLLFLAVFGTGLTLLHNEIQSEVQRGAELEQGMDSQVFVNQFVNFITLAGLYAVNFLTVMMTVLTSVDTVSGEISSGTIHTLVSKPIRRWEVLVGKWLGYSGLLTLYLVFMAGGVMLLVWLISGYQPPSVARGLGLLWLNAMLLLALSLLGGTRLSTLANGVMVFGLFGIAFVGGWIEQIGSFFQNTTAVNVGIVTSLLLPTEALWKRAAFEMQSNLLGLAGGMTPFTSSSVPSPAMILYAVLYALVMISLAVYSFSKRDL